MTVHHDKVEDVKNVQKHHLCESLYFKIILVKNKSKFGLQIHSLVSDKCVHLTKMSVPHFINTSLTLQLFLLSYFPYASKEKGINVQTSNYP